MFNCKKVNENEEITPSIKQSLHNFLHLTLTFFCFKYYFTYKRGI